MSVYCRVEKDGTRVYYLDYYDNGQRVRKKYGLSKKAAEREDKAIQGVLATEGTLIGTVVRQSPWFKDWSARYLANHCGHNARNTREQKAWQVKILTEFFDQVRRRRIGKIAGLDLEAYLAWRADRGHRLYGHRLKEGTADAELELLRHIWNVAKAQKPALVRGENPVEAHLLLKNRHEGDPAYRRGQREPAILTEESFHQWIEACRADDAHRLNPESASLVDLNLFVRYTGCRVGEALTLEPKDVDYVQRQFTFYQTKSGRPRVIPFTDRLVTILERQTAGNGRFFGEPADTKRHGYNRYRLAVARVRDKTGIDLTLHHFRHMARTHMDREGAREIGAAALVGHKIPGMRGRYSHARREDVLDALEKLGRPFPAAHGGEENAEQSRG